MGNWTLLATLAVAIAGCHPQPCGGCADYETCDVAANACVLNTGARFDLYATHGRVDGDNWDPFFGPPDPFVCVRPAGQMELCTSAISDSHTPKWDQQVAVDLDGATLTTAPMAVRYEDSDIDAADPICSGNFTFTAKLVHEGGLSFNCSNGASANFELRAINLGTNPLAATP
ncbi:MAG: hypothetical protein JWN44_2349 [Myxococcales bacterium]|nr:hypothetical protein [Myxococcales bacterium]